MVVASPCAGLRPCRVVLIASCPRRRRVQRQGESVVIKMPGAECAIYAGDGCRRELCSGLVQRARLVSVLFAECRHSALLHVPSLALCPARALVSAPVDRLHHARSGASRLAGWRCSAEVCRKPNAPTDSLSLRRSAIVSKLVYVFYSCHVIGAVRMQSMNGRAYAIVCLSHRSTAAAAAGGFAAERRRLQQISTDSCRRRAAGAGAQQQMWIALCSDDRGSRLDTNVSVLFNVSMN